MQEQIDLVVVAEEPKKTAGLSIGLVVSFILHLALVIFFVRSYRPTMPAAQNTPIARYVELIRQNPQEQEFVEAPGPKIDRAPSLDAPLSDANRRASTPNPTGDTPTKRPGDGSGLYTPPMGSNTPRGVQPQPGQQPMQQQAPQQPQQEPAAAQPSAAQQQAALDDTFVYRERTNKASAAAGAIDWRSAIREVRGPVGGGEGLDLGNIGGTGGDIGTADQGPLSFETSWYDWGPYAQSMVSRIRVNWYANMPQLIRTGIGGVVTIRFTIQRDGRITDITTLKSSGHPPYDHAARKAIELSSPLAPLPKDFPNPNERVTAMFYYNTPLP
ncbi:MAG TPA: energy transducer TonB [Thermoanaerobaculia bacterium]|nr:energy transducer TonB [Thermoanaerobaculia bacterium]